MSWLDDDTDNVATEERVQKPQDRYLKLTLEKPQWDEKTKTGKSTEKLIRILDERPAKVFRHWINSRPFNCPDNGKARTDALVCPECRTRNLELMAVRMLPEDTEEQKAFKQKKEQSVKNQHRMDHKYIVNVLVDNGKNADPRYEVKLFSFGRQLGMKMDVFRRYGDLTDMWITVVKTANGPADMNVGYDALFSPKNKLDDDESIIPQPFTDEQKSLIEDKFDLTEEVKPATKETLDAALKGGSTEESNEMASQEQIDILEEALKAEGLQWRHFNVADTKSLSAAKAAELIRGLKG